MDKITVQMLLAIENRLLKVQKLIRFESVVLNAEIVWTHLKATICCCESFFNVVLLESSDHADISNNASLHVIKIKLKLKSQLFQIVH